MTYPTVTEVPSARLETVEAYYAPDDLFVHVLTYVRGGRAIIRHPMYGQTTVFRGDLRSA